MPLTTPSTIGVILVRRASALPRLARRYPVNRPKAQRIHHRQRPRAHGEDVAQNPAHAGGRALEGLDVAGVVVALDLEGAGPAVAHVDDAGILARPLHDAIALGGQPLQMHAAGLVGAVFAPHHAVDAQFGERGHTPQRRLDAAVFIRGDAVLGQQLRGYRNRLGNDCRGGSGHHDYLHCRTAFTFGQLPNGVKSRSHAACCHFAAISGKWPRRHSAALPQPGCGLAPGASLRAIL